MKILYLSCHSINEYEDIKMFSELGHEIVSQGAYNNPEKPGDNMRPPLHGIYYNPEMAELAKTLYWDYTTTSIIPKKLIEWCDIIYILGIHQWLLTNWDRIKHKKVVFRSIGQSIPSTEQILAKFRREGLKIVRYSPVERRIPGYCGEDALIRFYKDEDEYKDWNGKISRVITVAQNMKNRGWCLHYDIFEKATRGLPRTLYGKQNENAGKLFGGCLNYEELKQAYRDNRVFFYTGTHPAPYTMAFQEAFMTGTPIVSIGKQLAGWDLEIPEIIENGVHGFWSDSIRELHEYTKLLLEDYNLAKKISENARKKAIELFSKHKIREQWKNFFDQLA